MKINCGLMIFDSNFLGRKVYLEFFIDKNINIIVVLLKMVCYIVYSVEICLRLKFNYLF